MIEASGLTKLYGTFRAISDVGFSVDHGEIVGLLGPNGAGKSTTILHSGLYSVSDHGHGQRGRP